MDLYQGRKTRGYKRDLYLEIYIKKGCVTVIIDFYACSKAINTTYAFAKVDGVDVTNHKNTTLMIDIFQSFFRLQVVTKNTHCNIMLLIKVAKQNVGIVLTMEEKINIL